MLKTVMVITLAATLATAGPVNRGDGFHGYLPAGNSGCGALPTPSPGVAVLTPKSVLGPLDDWSQRVWMSQNTGETLFQGDNPNGTNGAYDTEYSSKYNLPGYGWCLDLQAGNGYIKYWYIDLTGFEGADSVQVYWTIRGRGTGGSSYAAFTVDNYPVWVPSDPIPSDHWYFETWVDIGGQHFNWDSPSNWVTVVCRTPSTDDLLWSGTQVWVYGAHGAVPPEPFSLISPEDGAQDQPTSGTLSWESSSGATSYDVYWGTSDPPEYKENVSDVSTSYFGSPDQTYHWYVVAKNAAGETECNARFSFATTPTAVREEASSTLGRYSFGLDGASPNPFRRYTSISYALPRDGSVKLRILSSSGAVVRTLRDGLGQKGLQRVVWNGMDDRGVRVGKGVYFCSLEAGEERSLKKVVRLE
ncbi:MAG: hypothetical protein NTX53_06275 [candidate division WOR-3 bacterium]|nr:hypothetical protein [candidate division WOR-3 bacterium]